jgi:hypothetical protein
MLVEERPTTVAFERKLAELKVRGREETINEHLAKLLAFDVLPDLRESWKRELLRKHLLTLAAFRLKPEARLIPQRDWWRWPYADPFEGNEAGYASALIARHEGEYPRNTRSAAEIASAIHDFHAGLAPLLARGEAGAGLLASL